MPVAPGGQHQGHQRNDHDDNGDQAIPPPRHSHRIGLHRRRRGDPARGWCRPSWRHPVQAARVVIATRGRTGQARRFGGCRKRRCAGQLARKPLHRKREGLPELRSSCWRPTRSLTRTGHAGCVPTVKSNLPRDTVIPRIAPLWSTSGECALPHSVRSPDRFRSQPGTTRRRLGPAPSSSRHPSKRSWALLATLGCRNFDMALASIWRIRSRVRWKCSPISSSV